MLKFNKDLKIGIIGLGYVGLPLAVEFGKKHATIGFDVNQTRITELLAGIDKTRETDTEGFKAAIHATYTTDAADLKNCNVYIVTVPTPIDQFNKPDLSHLEEASTTIGMLLGEGDVVIYESTVYPGCTEETCIPILETISGLESNKDFFYGYSPERINPGDKERTLATILKIVAGSTPETTDFLEELYSSIITAGIYKAPSVQVAEAAKAIENAQRDINISFVNELALMFDRMGIDTTEVLEAASTKWNFLNLKPGLVGGHCIGIDPYYLAYKAQSLGYSPQVISSSREINDGMGAFVVKKLLKKLIARGFTLSVSKILILGITFKENCPDIRNTKVVDVYNELNDFGLEVDVYDPWVFKADVRREYGIDIVGQIDEEAYDGIILAVAHNEFKKLDIKKYKRNKNAVIFDLKSLYSKSDVDLRL